MVNIDSKIINFLSSKFKFFSSLFQINIDYARKRRKGNKKEQVSQISNTYFRKMFEKIKYLILAHYSINCRLFTGLSMG